MDFDYHDSFRRLMCGMRDAEYEICDTLKASADVIVDKAKGLNFEGDLHYFLSEYSGSFTLPNSFHFVPFQGDDVSRKVYMCSWLCHLGTYHCRPCLRIVFVQKHIN